MANPFPPCIKYKQDFNQNDMKTELLERNIPDIAGAGGRKVKIKILKFDGESVEMLLLCKQRFKDAMVAQAIDEAEWQEEFG